MKIIALVLLALGSMLAGCAERGTLIYGWQETSTAAVHRALVGTWRSSDARVLILSADGSYKARSSSGCWRVHGNQLTLTSPCSNHGVAPASPSINFADLGHECSFELNDHLIAGLHVLTLGDCPEQGEYRLQG